MLKLKKIGGERAASGNYWNFATGERVTLEAEGILPGDAATTYYRVHPAALIAIAPALGLAYAVFLPFIGIAMLAGIVSKKILGGAVETLWKGSSFGWRPSEAYLAGKKGKNAKKDNAKKDDEKKENH
jgi:hypothetical protein